MLDPGRPGRTFPSGNEGKILALFSLTKEKVPSSSIVTRAPKANSSYKTVLFVYLLPDVYKSNTAHVCIFKHFGINISTALLTLFLFPTSVFPCLPMSFQLVDHISKLSNSKAFLAEKHSGSEGLIATSAVQQTNNRISITLSISCNVFGTKTTKIRVV